MPPIYVDSAPDRLVVYTLGPGFGECQLVLAPGGQSIMVDACTKGRRNFGLDLLTALGRSHVDLFVVSHPDTDHVRGAHDVLLHAKPTKVWTYPVYASLRDFLAPVFRRAGSPAPKRLKDLDEFLSALEPYETEERVWSMSSNLSEEWRSTSGQCVVRPLAPTSYDKSKSLAHIGQLIRKDSAGVALANELADYLDGKRDSAGDRPNRISVALSVEWATRRVLLAGDVEEGDGHERSGWRGVLTGLTARGDLARVQDVDVVKVAHHGSDGAFLEEAWREHCRGNRPTTLLIAPFSSSRLPDEEALRKLGLHAARLAVSTPLHDTAQWAEGHGWKPSTAAEVVAHPDWDLPVVAAEIPATGPPKLHLSARARAWTH